MYERYAIFYTPRPGQFADFCASWLGWDSVHGRKAKHPSIGDVDVATLTQTPRKYGIHGTLKPPFRLADGQNATDLEQATADLAATIAPVMLAGMGLKHHRGFLALRPRGDGTALASLAQKIVETLDRFRAPAPESELNRRRKAGLSERQEANLQRWGYPYVGEDFHFHLTLSGRIDPALGAEVTDMLAPHLLPLVPRPFPIDRITLMGEDQNGMFHEIRSFELTG